MKKMALKIVGPLILLIPGFRWILDIIGLAGVPEDLSTWNIVVGTMLEDPWLYVPILIGTLIIAFTSFPALRFWEATKTSIKLTVGESGPYHTIGPSIYQIRRTLNIGLENIGQSDPISSGSLTILSVSPNPGDDGPWVLTDGTPPLAAGEISYIPLVTYGESRDANKPQFGDSFITTETANSYPLMDVLENEGKYTMTIRATALGTAHCDFKCRVWVGDTGQLRIEEA